MSTHIRTNNIPRDIITYLDLSEKEKLDFDYVKEDDYGSPSFFRYRGYVYYLGNFMRTQCLTKWDGVQHDSMSSGVCVRYTKDFERVIVGTFWS